MDWGQMAYGAVLSAIFSGILGGILWTMKKKGKLSKNVSFVIFITLTVVWNIFYFEVIMKNNSLLINGNETVAFQWDTPVFLILKVKDPKVYGEFKELVSTLQKEGKNWDEILSEIAKKTVSLTNERILFAPDENVISHIKVVIEQMEVLQKISGEKCLHFVMPDLKKSLQVNFDMLKFFPKELYLRRVKTDEEMIMASYGEKQYQLSNESNELAFADFNAVIFDLIHNKYGNDFLLLESPESAYSNAEKSCELLIDMNKKIVELPPEKAARIYRYLISQIQ
ncbi:hypothetical protein Xmau_00726 [Xenorhabdus mauleonii]|uniref:Uncharacterized protein n=1 Tax=Xenorhabdus mauleonii TaxID=351675 RepID=A0A1I3X5H0_9GAMM|nr:hypothetical protein [Xenorhabdus mauleonii]PHM46316.1 hypothetical protein Xmau_00726 [Xenorhabdus mauleonii]SFK15082.1 hypothetical protein SAMN05421680_13216 [Xenorhabdus mauleonii]